MTTGTWWSQPFPAEGTMASEGIRKQLGTPRLDPLVVLVRESAQNSWDARSAEHGPVSVQYAFETLDENRASAFRAALLPAPEGSNLDPAMLSAGGQLLRVSDRGTTGLGGPLRSDEPIGSGSADFVNFVRNVGEPRDREYGGGTYGFGKGIFFSVSAAATILVDTVCIEKGRRQRRLMGSALGSTFVKDNRRFTGRHWFGSMATSVIDPLLDSEADDVAGALGLRGFNDAETGTDVYVIAPDTGCAHDESERSNQDAARIVAGSAAWYLWPKLVERSGPPALIVTVTCEGVNVPVPEPARSRRLRPFVRALAVLDSGGGTPLERKSAPRHIGSIAIETAPWIDETDASLAAAEPFSGPGHHCARMRHVELVVDYFEGAPSSMPDSQYAAVFRGSTEADEHFASAEPPTHDSWISEHLTGTAHWVVTKSRRFIVDEMTSIARPDESSTRGADVPLGRLSSALAGAIPGVLGDGGAPHTSGGGGGGGGSSNAAVSTIGPPRLEERDGSIVVAQGVRFQSGSVAARASASVSVDGARERSAPTGASVPEVLRWVSATGASTVEGPELSVEAADERDWTILVRPADDTSTLVSVAERR